MCVLDLRASVQKGDFPGLNHTDLFGTYFQQVIIRFFGRFLDQKFELRFSQVLLFVCFFFFVFEHAFFHSLLCVFLN